MGDPGTTGTTGSWTDLRVAALVPPAILGLAVAAVLVGALIGWHPLWPSLGLTPSEAAVLRDAAEIVTLVQQGHDLNRRYPVRAGLIQDETIELTPLEGAITTRDDEFFKFLLDHGASLEGVERTVLICLARQEGADEIGRLIPADSSNSVDCSTVDLPWRR